MREVEARLKLSAVDRTAKAFAAVSSRLDAIDYKTRAINRTQAAVARQASASIMAIGRGLAPAAVAYAATQSLVRFAEVERALNRIGNTAGATAAQTKEAFTLIDKAAYDYAMGQDRIVAGLDVLTASGRSLDSALGFLPAVAATAQAAGAEIEDIAKTADAVGTSFDIAGDKMQGTMDILVTGGQLGKFELKDMASYLPTLAPAFEALGYRGETAVMKLVAALQVVRNGTGSAEEAATAFSQVLQKMETNEVATKFKSFGIDLRAEMAKARAEGRDLLEVFVDLSRQAVGGDLSKLPQLFGDAQMITAVRALNNGVGEMGRLMEALGHSSGAVKANLDVILADNQAKIDRLSISWDRLLKTFGGGVADVAGPVLEWVNADIDDQAALVAGYDKTRIGDETNYHINQDYEKKYREVHPNAPWGAFWPGGEGRTAQNEALRKVGRGQAKTIDDDLNLLIGARTNGRFPGPDDARAASTAFDARHADSLDGSAPRTGIPMPTSRPDEAPLLSLRDQRAEYDRGRRLGERSMRQSDENMAGLDVLAGIIDLTDAATKRREDDARSAVIDVALPESPSATREPPIASFPLEAQTDAMGGVTAPPAPRVVNPARFGDAVPPVEGAAALRAAMAGPDHGEGAVALPPLSEVGPAPIADDRGAAALRAALDEGRAMVTTAGALVDRIEGMERREIGAVSLPPPSEVGPATLVAAPRGTIAPAAPDTVSAEMDTDALRRAMEEGGASLTMAATEAGAAVETAGQAAGGSIETAGASAGGSIQSGGAAAAAAIAAVFGPGAAVIAEAIRSALSQGVKVSVSGGAPALPAANRAPARTMPDAGKAGG